MKLPNIIGTNIVFWNKLSQAQIVVTPFRISTKILYIKWNVIQRFDELYILYGLEKYILNQICGTESLKNLSQLTALMAVYVVSMIKSLSLKLFSKLDFVAFHIKWLPSCPLGLDGSYNPRIISKV